MCFSPEISFAAAGVLGAIGVTTIKKSQKKEQLPLASIPLLFAIQQLIEGFLWLADKPSTEATYLTYAFLFFAYILWPIWVPFSYYLLEKSPKTKKAFRVLCGIGLIISLSLLTLLFLHNPLVIEFDNHLKYKLLTSASADNMLISVIGLGLYTTAVCGVGLFSHHKYLRVFSFATFISLLISLFFYTHNWQSVWCFFAAILSAIIYLHLHSQK